MYYIRKFLFLGCDIYLIFFGVLIYFSRINNKIGKEDGERSFVFLIRVFDFVSIDIYVGFIIEGREYWFIKSCYCLFLIFLVVVINIYSI